MIWTSYTRAEPARELGSDFRENWHLVEFRRIRCAIFTAIRLPVSKLLEPIPKCKTVRIAETAIERQKCCIHTQDEA